MSPAAKSKGSGHGTYAAYTAFLLHPSQPAHCRPLSPRRLVPRTLPQVVVCTSAPLAEAKRLDALCHAAGIAFIWAETRGVFARVFTDFGPNFTVYDVDGEPGEGPDCGAGGGRKGQRAQVVAQRSVQ